jgi:hypothetical protein
MVGALLLASLFAQNHELFSRLIAGLTHEESLRQPSGRDNCLNWLIGHLVVARANLLAQLGASSAWGWGAGRRHIPVLHRSPDPPRRSL